MKTSMGSYFIKPTENWREDDKDSLGSSLQHAIYRVPAAPSSDSNGRASFDIFQDGVKSHNCGVIGKRQVTRLSFSCQAIVFARDLSNGIGTHRNSRKRKYIFTWKGEKEREIINHFLFVRRWRSNSRRVEREIALARQRFACRHSLFHMLHRARKKQRRISLFSRSTRTYIHTRATT